MRLRRTKKGKSKFLSGEFCSFDSGAEEQLFTFKQ